MSGHKATWAVQQLLPPALLTYFFWAWKICTFEIGPTFIGKTLQHPLLGATYSAFASISLGTLTLLFLRLYLLPSRQGIPPRDPPDDIQLRRVIFQVSRPPEYPGDVKIERCYKDECKGRWKPARTRHCSTCKVCRVGYDHHCAFFANCLTAPYIPLFLTLLLFSPPIFFLLSLPLLKPLTTRTFKAYHLSRTDPTLKEWWAWSWSWILPAGPVGWRRLDVLDPEKDSRAGVTVMVLVGGLLSLICLALLISSFLLIQDGRLAVDRGRQLSHMKIQKTILKLQSKSQPIPTTLQQSLLELSEQEWFFVPLGPPGQGEIVFTLPDVKPYDHGSKRNRELVGLKGWWFLPWKAMKATELNVWNWELAEGVQIRLREEAKMMRLERMREGEEYD
ncbi:hypothetical protein TREMEDRAFT_58413 [Tremella mesenterica DSM 1558]|uniref:uncharacterized protein n=1 Tax=Tremella mesenterica (strain ATCC 24925 / CBS 8224 / DSM 1558 / NBRC 9311 / NRRL Y-6157 / RJB 2259-6 / UBC 559-6) TaxID=578456 RepID=UPI0003F4982B|nr:uncharacterized protein TREMEDRAFT_58413 [Tremella mesenterica DSM 1558]EIW72253.1 hypothetical protein TREMEDRAFT_58413 [Tremella mesenterica DSM 1558]